MRAWTASLALALSVSFAPYGSGRAGELNRPIPAPTVEAAASAAGREAVAVLAGGCFWGQQGLFEHVKGVRRVVAGYAGGSAATANYRDVSSETTGHAEAVEITFDPWAVSYGELLRIFFSVAHDPTQLNRQGPDSGPSYRSAIFPAGPEQARIARVYIAQLERAGIFDDPIVTTIEPQKGFHPAEPWHQDYMRLYPQSAYIKRYDLPKLAVLQRLYPEHFREEPVRYAGR